MIIKSNLNKRGEDKGYDVIAYRPQKREWRERTPRRAPRETQEKRMRLSLTASEDKLGISSDLIVLVCELIHLSGYSSVNFNFSVPFVNQD